MKRCSEFHRRIITASAFIACAAGVLANGQATTAPRTPDPKENQSSAAAVGQGGTHGKISREVGYREFITGIGMDEEHFQGAIKAGKQPLVPRISFSRSMGTSEDEEDVIYSVILTAYRDLKANDAKYGNDHDNLQRQDYSPQRDAKLQALYEDRNKNEIAIVKSAMEQLKELLTEEDFRKLDRAVSLQERIGK
jgi:hypothetical protein